jgi:hypothetical protein
MERVTPFDDALLPGRYSNLDLQWKQFISDHVQSLKKLATFAVVNNFPRELKWIVYLINDIKSDIDFVKIRSIYIPSEQTIENHYSKYLTTRTVTP